MTREVVLDTETTGLDPASDRVVEVGALEVVNLIPSGRVFHAYINPGRSVPAEAVRVHGLDDTFLADKPTFEEIAPDFLGFIGDARLVIHNAAFDLSMLNAEFARLGLEPLSADRCVDTLELARRRFPGSPASLDALCRRFGIDNSGRDKHGALLDAQLLAEVYLELKGGRQAALGLDPVRPAEASGDRPNAARAPVSRSPGRPGKLPRRLTETEAAAHRAFVETLGPDALWYRYRGSE